MELQVHAILRALTVITHALLCFRNHNGMQISRSVILTRISLSPLQLLEVNHLKMLHFINRNKLVITHLSTAKILWLRRLALGTFLKVSSLTPGSQNSRLKASHSVGYWMATVCTEVCWVQKGARGVLKRRGDFLGQVVGRQDGESIIEEMVEKEVVQSQIVEGRL